ncbi:Pecanex-like protein 1 [Toxocara canis]|uniref:Pecanex-like protein n=1 Tax=Toxocara canis TaxID=6265 RepID=A0A0B2VXJ3_TOXCA|nr:Pecanex-like protein 1 [Toxocara canis]
MISGPLQETFYEPFSPQRYHNLFCYLKDEDGNWWTYAFDAQGVGTAHALGSSRALLEMIQHNNATHPYIKLSALPENVSGSSEDSDVERAAGGRENARAIVQSQMVGGERRQRALSSSSTESGTYIADMPSAILHASNSAVVSRHLDRDRTIFEAISRCITSMEVGSTSEPRRSSVIHKSYYYRLKVFPSKKGGKGIHLQFSLLKSVQPDAASPIHGFNWLVAYSRPAFFCLLGLTLLAIDGDWWDHRAAETTIGWEWNPYRIGSVSNASIIAAVRDLIVALVLLLPVAFTLGLLPQVNTLLLHVAEQVEMHVFGGTACFSLLSAVLQLSKSMLALAVLCALAHVAHREDSNSVQNTFFSAFAAISVALSYLLSRSSSNPAMMALGLKSFGLCSGCSCHEEVSEVGDEGKGEESVSPMKDTMADDLTRVVSNRLRHDILVSMLIALIFFALHCTSMFTAAQPYLQVSEVGDEGKGEESVSPMKDTMADDLTRVVSNRLRHDILVSMLIALIFFALHCTSMFTAAQPYLQMGLCGTCVLFGVINHYFYMELRTATPWRLLARPVLRAHEFAQFETVVAAKLMYFETVHFYMLTFEKNIVSCFFFFKYADIRR